MRSGYGDAGSCGVMGPVQRYAGMVEMVKLRLELCGTR